MKNILLLLSFLFFPVVGFTFFGKKYEILPKSKKMIKKQYPSKQQVEKWFDTYSCNELDIKELTLIAHELHKIIDASDGKNVCQLETLLAECCNEVAKKHLHTECFLAVVKACEEAILKKFKQTSTFKQTLLAYSQKIEETLVKKDAKLEYKVS